MRVNQSYEGVRTAQAIINLALMTGNIGRPGTGANSITGQCNAMAADVDLALRDIIISCGGQSASEAKLYVQELKRQKRYVRDVY